MTQFRDLIEQMTPEIYQRLRRAVELGRWPDGRALTAEQRELCMQATLTYEHLNVAETDRTGYIDRGSKADGERCEHPADDDVQTLVLGDGGERP